MSSVPGRAWRILLILLTSVLAFPASAPAQPESAIAQPGDTLPCQFPGRGAPFCLWQMIDPAWAKPDFDDGKWALVHVPGELRAQIMHG